MNKIHNVIWSKVKGCYVVVSELVRFCKHSSTGGGSKQIRALLTAMIMLGGGMSVQAWNPSVIIDHVDSNGNIIANNGYGAFDTDNYLYDYKNPGNLSPGWEENGESIRYGMHSVGGIAIGRYTDIVSETARAGTYQSGIALGDYARAKGSFAVGIGAYSQATDIAAMAIGAAAKATGFNSLAMMRKSAALGTYSTAIGTASWADAESSFALGYSSTALGKQSIAIGAAAKKVSWDDKGTQIGSYVSDGHT
uniref:ESPR-type extended signal peptide-containing protein n=1 Tax=Veillonella magna TaxID=464322 RepID=UPI00402ABFE4